MINMLSFQKWIYSKKNIAGMSSALIGIILYLSGFIEDLWLPIIIGFYILGYLVAPKEKTTTFYHIKGENLNDYIGFLNRLKNTSNSKLPAEAVELLNNISTNAQELIEFVGKNPNGIDGLSEDMVNIRRIFDNYLPKLINQYILLPKRYAEQVKTSIGKTPKQMLLEQMKILDEQVQKIAYAIYENDVQTLRTHGKILDQQFNQKELFVLDLEKSVGE